MSDDGKPPEPLESKYLAMIDMWINTGVDGGELNAMIVRNFDQVDFEAKGVDVLNEATKHLPKTHFHVARTREKCYATER